MKYFVLFNFLLVVAYSSELVENDSVNQINSENNTTVEIEEPEEKELNHPEEDVMVIKDESGLSDDAIRQKAKTADKKKTAKVSIADVVEATDDKGTVDISKIQDKWEDLSPTPIQYDWVRTKSGEWFKGTIKGFYDQTMEFDSDEIGLYEFDFEDIVEIKSYHIISVNIENLASFPGILRLKGKKLTIIQGENSYDFDRKDMISFAPDGEHERNFWSGKATLSFDLREGNTNQYDYTGKLELHRRTASTNLSMSYLGRITEKDHIQTTENHRLNANYNRYLSRRFFWTPVFVEIYTDRYKNIDRQYTWGLGAGYTLIDTRKTRWNISGGPAFLYTKYSSVVSGNKLAKYSPALEFATKYESKLNEIIDFTFDYKGTYTDKYAGTYKHHMLVTFENELTSWLDLDITGVWDYILEPEELSNKSFPVSSDLQLLIGLGIEF